MGNPSTPLTPAFVHALLAVTSDNKSSFSMSKDICGAYSIAKVCQAAWLWRSGFRRDGAKRCPGFRR
jgi:hypothetical protein